MPKSGDYKFFNGNLSVFSRMANIKTRREEKSFQRKVLHAYSYVIGDQNLRLQSAWSVGEGHILETHKEKRNFGIAFL